jgi:hypothetical protein
MGVLRIGSSAFALALVTLLGVLWWRERRKGGAA